MTIAMHMKIYDVNFSPVVMTAKHLWPFLAYGEHRDV